MQSLVKNNILGVDVTDATEAEVLEYIFNFLSETKDKLYIVTPNPEIIMYAKSHEPFRATLNQAGIAVCDGVGLLWASRILGKPLKGRISGVDLMEKLCKESVRKAVTVGFLGGRPGVAERIAECLMKKYPGLNVVFVAEEWEPDGFSSTEKLKVSSISYLVSGKERKKQNTKYQIPNTTIDILFVAFGFPKQEEWMAKNIEKLPVRVMMGVGGSFDYISGEVHRAPKLLRSLGLEWLFRLIRQPWRLRRQTALLGFMILLLRQRLGLNSLS